MSTSANWQVADILMAILIVPQTKPIFKLGWEFDSSSYMKFGQNRMKNVWVPIKEDRQKDILRLLMVSGHNKFMGLTSEGKPHKHILTSVGQKPTRTKAH